MDGIDAALGNDGEAAAQSVCEFLSHLDAAGVGGNDHGFCIHFALHVGDEHGGSVEMVHRDIKEALDLLSMQVHGQHAVHTGSGQQVCDQLGGDGHAGTVFSVLTGIAIVGDHGGDAGSRSAAGGIDHDQKFHQVFVGGGAGGLDDEHIRISEAVLILDEHFAIREFFHGCVSEFLPHAACDCFREFAVRVAGIQPNVSRITFHLDVNLR